MGFSIKSRKLITTMKFCSKNRKMMKILFKLRMVDYIGGILKVGETEMKWIISHLQTPDYPIPREYCANIIGDGYQQRMISNTLDETMDDLEAKIEELTAASKEEELP